MFRRLASFRGGGNDERPQSPRGAQEAASSPQESQEFVGIEKPDSIEMAIDEDYDHVDAKEVVAPGEFSIGLSTTENIETKEMKLKIALTVSNEPAAYMLDYQWFDNGRRQILAFFNRKSKQEQRKQYEEEYQQNWQIPYPIDRPNLFFLFSGKWDNKKFLTRKDFEGKKIDVLLMDKANRHAKEKSVKFRSILRSFHQKDIEIEIYKETTKLNGNKVERCKARTENGKSLLLFACPLKDDKKKIPGCKRMRIFVFLEEEDKIYELQSQLSKKRMKQSNPQNPREIILWSPEENGRFIEEGHQHEDPFRCVYEKDTFEHWIKLVRLNRWGTHEVPVAKNGTGHNGAESSHGHHHQKAHLLGDDEGDHQQSGTLSHGPIEIHDEHFVPDTGFLADSFSEK